MKSKNSFFNKTIFLKNVTLYWPIWAVYTLISVIMQPFLLWLFNNCIYGLKDSSKCQKGSI